MKLNGHVYSFLLFVSSRPLYQARLEYIESGLLVACWDLDRSLQERPALLKVLSQPHLAFLHAIVQRLYFIQSMLKRRKSQRNN